jgi:hypothetical protein
MNWLRSLYTRLPRRCTPIQQPRSPARLCLEGLETRLAPASVFVVPATQLVDATHRHFLGEAIAAAGANGLVTVEPGTPPQSATVALNGLNGLTIQGDPNLPGSILTPYSIEVQASNVTLTNLNLSSVMLDAASSGDNVNKCLIQQLTAFSSSSSFTQNTFTGHNSVSGAGGKGGDLFVNNSFTSVGDMLSIDSSPGTVVTQNTFIAISNGNAINLSNTQGIQNLSYTISNNSITLPTPSSQAIARCVAVNLNNANTSATVKILNNTFKTNNLSIGVDINGVAGLSVLLQGNDFHNNSEGVSITGDGSSAGTIDLGGGPLASLGGNNFRGFTSAASASSGAIILSSASTTTVTALQNLFRPGVTPSSVVFAQSGAINVSQPLSDQRAFVQALYNECLGRSGSLSELDGWVSVLSTQGQAAVASGIFRSAESLGRIVDSAYLRFLGRQSDPSGRANWVSFLQRGGTQEQLETLFLTSAEYLSHINTDFVQSLYLNLLGRSGAASELAGWNNNLQTLGLAGIANAFTGSTENRLDGLASDYQTFLHRPASSAELAAANSSQDLLSLAVTVLVSSEFFTNG